MRLWKERQLLQSSYLRGVKLGFPGLVQALVLVAAVPEGHDSAHIEVVLTHADPRLPLLRHRLVQHPLVDLRMDINTKAPENLCNC